MHIEFTDTHGKQRRLNATDIVGVAPTTTGMCGKLPERVEATRIFLSQGGSTKALNRFEEVQKEWLGVLRNGGDRVLAPTTVRVETQVSYHAFSREEIYARDHSFSALFGD